MNSHPSADRDARLTDGLNRGACIALSARRPGERSRTVLESLYADLNRRSYIEPDPLQFVWNYKEVRDREIVALIAASLAYGRVRQILRSVGEALDPMGLSPFAFVTETPSRTLGRVYAGFKHRFTPGAEVAGLIAGIKKALARHGSLNACFCEGQRPSDYNVLPALERWVDVLGCGDGSLIPAPARGSACKRLHLFLRWMVRRDDVDPGGWTGVSPARLIVPLDTHMAAMARRFGWSDRKSADSRMAMEVTEWFRRVNPDDPVKYDFSLTRFGIRRGMAPPVDRTHRDH